MASGSRARTVAHLAASVWAALAWAALAGAALVWAACAPSVAWGQAAPLLPEDSLAAADGGAKPADEPAARPPAPPRDPPTVEMVCAPDAVRMAEPLVCTLTVRHTPDVTVTVSAASRATPGSATPSVPDGDALVTTRTFSLRAMTLRELKVEGVSVRWQAVDGAEGVVRVPPRRVPVRSVLGNQTDPAFRDYEQPGGDADAFWARHGPLPHRTTHWPLVIATGGVLGLLVGLGIGWLVKRALDARRRPPEVVVDPRPAHVIALANLDALEREDLPGQGLTKEYYSRLSEILRDFLELRFGFNALEMTSDEIRASLAQQALSTEANLAAEELLGETDLVKFADFSPDAGEIELVMRQTRGFVELTRAPDVTPDPVPGGGEART